MNPENDRDLRKQEKMASLRISDSPHTFIASNSKPTIFDLVRKKSEEIKESGKISGNELRQLLSAVELGHLDKVKGYLETNRNKHGQCLILDVQGDVIRPWPHKAFKNLTAFQHSLRNCDIGMCKLIRSYFSNDYNAAKQMIALEQDQELVRLHGYTYFTLEDTLKAYKELIEIKWKELTGPQRDKYFRKVIGGLQQKWPMWLFEVGTEAHT